MSTASKSDSGRTYRIECGHCGKAARVPASYSLGEQPFQFHCAGCRRTTVLSPADLRLAGPAAGPPPLPPEALPQALPQAVPAAPEGPPWFYSYIRICALLSLALGLLAFLAGLAAFAAALASPAYRGEAWPLWVLSLSILAMLAGLFVAAALLLGLDAGESLRGLLRQGEARRGRRQAEAR